MLDNSLSQERSRRTGLLFAPQQWCAKEVRGVACKICSLPMIDGETHVGDPPLELKWVDSEKKEEKDSLFMFPTQIWCEEESPRVQGNSAQNTAVRNASDQLLQSRFISGLRNDIRRFVLSRDPLNLDEPINAALIEEQNMKLNQIASEERSGLSSAQTENPVLSALADRLEEINLRVGRLQEASAVTARKSGGNYFNRRENVFKCFYCGIQVRRQAECRKKQRDERAARYQHPRRNAASEYFSNHPGSEGRHVHYRKSALRDNYAAQRHSADAPRIDSLSRGFSHTPTWSDTSLPISHRSWGLSGHHHHDSSLTDIIQLSNHVSL
ncbi:hypothetical protein TNCV_4513501 [Trichonephila clavipes]|nr:hypothetical protein TNCV_4513501 [Trichonephila clavipes]